MIHYRNESVDNNSVYTIKNIDVTNTELETVYIEKALGIHFTNNLKFDEHINKVVNKVNIITGLIKKRFSYMDKNNVLTLYKSLIRLHLYYGNGIYYPVTKKNKRIIENVHRRNTKL